MQEGTRRGITGKGIDRNNNMLSTETNYPWDTAPGWQAQGRDFDPQYQKKKGSIITQISVNITHNLYKNK